MLWHPRVCPGKNLPFCGVVSGVTHQSVHASHPHGSAIKPSVVTTVVWLAEEHAPPELFCDCSEEEQTKHVVVDGACDNCGLTRRER